MSEGAPRYNCVIVINVNGDHTEEPQPGRCPPDHRLVVVVQNFTGNDYEVTIDPDVDFKLRQTMSPAKPLAAGRDTAKPKAGEIEMIKFKIRPKGEFGSSALPYGTYKFVAHLVWKEGGATKTFDLDPDLDIPPP